MLLFWCSPKYLVTMAVIAMALLWWLRMMLRKIRSVRQQPAELRKSPFWFKPLFACWFLISLLYALELGFASFVNTTDAFNATNVSARWFARQVDPDRNRDGFRDRRNFGARRNETKSRMIMIGDSFTIAQGIDDIDKRFTNLCEKTLNRRRNPDQKLVEIYNMGEFGWEVSVIESIVKVALDSGYDPDVVVYIYMLNDIEVYDPRTEEAIKVVSQDQPQFILWTETYFFNWMHFLWRQKQAQRTVDYFPHLADSYREPPWIGVQRSLDAMHQHCEENGTELRMVFFPFLHNLGPNYDFKHAHQQLADYCTSRGIRYLDLEPVLSPHHQEQLTVHRFDNHPNEHCHAIVAEAISNKLLDDFPRSELEAATEKREN